MLLATLIIASVDTVLNALIAWFILRAIGKNYESPTSMDKVSELYIRTSGAAALGSSLIRGRPNVSIAGQFLCELC
jgi:hypothetical protein